MTSGVAGAGAYLGSRDATGTLASAVAVNPNPFGAGNWTATFDPKLLAFSANLTECYHIALKGPAGSQMQMYIDQTFYDTTSRGDINSWDPQHTLLLRGGQSLVFHWNSGAAPAPFITTWWRIPAATFT